MHHLHLPLIYTIKDFKYNPQAFIGKGAYGSVYFGIDTRKPEGQNYVAIKRIDLEALNKKSEYLVECVHKEIEIQQSINNENVLSILGYHNEGKYQYIIFPFCNEGDLGQVLLKKKILDEKEALNILKQILNGFKELSRLKIAHRDLKPDNIFINNGVCKIADFGFARYYEPNIMMKSMVGTPLYESPQILLNQQYTEQTDIWSIGMIYYEMLTGGVPWNCNKIEDLPNTIKKYPVRFNIDLNISEFSKDFITKCLRSKEELRFNFENIFDHELFKQDIKKQICLTKSQIQNSSKKLQNNIKKLQQEFFDKQIDLKSLFQKIDIDNNVENLSFQEFKEFLKEFKQNFSYSDQKQLFRIFDLNDSGQISIKLFEQQIFNMNFDVQNNPILYNQKYHKIIKKIKGIIQNEQISIHMLFKKFSKYENDLNLQNFTQFINHIDQNITDSEIYFIFQHFDIDNNNSISFKEFQINIEDDFNIMAMNITDIDVSISYELEQEIISIKRFIQEHDLNTQQLFKEYDIKNLNWLDEQQFSKMILSIRQNFKKELIPTFFQVFDVNQNGKIEYQEFLSIFHQQ